MKSRLVLRILWGLCCLLLLWMVVSDSIQFSKHPELYPIGCEGLGWSYESSENYECSGDSFSFGRSCGTVRLSVASPRLKAVGFTLQSLTHG